MAKGKVTCVTCGAQYEVCRKCEETAKTFKSWRLTACSLEHWEISQVINQWFYQQISTKEAQDSLLKLGADKLEEATDITREYVDKILAADPPTPKKKQPKKNEDSVSEDTSDTI